MTLTFADASYIVYPGWQDNPDQLMIDAVIDERVEQMQAIQRELFQIRNDQMQGNWESTMQCIGQLNRVWNMLNQDLEILMKHSSIPF